MTLDLLPPGETATITGIGGRGVFRRRLMELGILPGTPIRRTGQAPLGDPLSFRVRDTVVCLRRREAAAVALAVEPVEMAAK